MGEWKSNRKVLRFAQDDSRGDGIRMTVLLLVGSGAMGEWGRNRKVLRFAQDDSHGDGSGMTVARRIRLMLL
jgi:hypothetical protein